MALSEALNHFHDLIAKHAGSGAGILRSHLVTIRDQADALESNYTVLESNHAELKNEHAESKAYADQIIADLEKENLDLEVRLAAFEQNKPNELPEKTIKILCLFFEKDAALDCEQISLSLKMKSSIVKYHCDKLIGREFLWLGSAGWADQPTPYILTDKGRAFIMEREPD